MTRLLIDEDFKDKSTIGISGDELHYLTRVRRHKRGDMVEIQDRLGQRFEAVIASLDSKQATLNIEKELCPVGDCLPIHLIVAVPKRNLLDDVVRKLSELNIASITPAIAERSVVKPGESKLKRWRTIARESRRQCGRKKELEVCDVVSLEQALKSCPNSGSKIFLDTQSRGAPSIWSKRTLKSPVYAVIGPEGGFGQKERELAESLGFVEASLGQTILRVETATIATAVLCSAILGGFD